MVVSIGIFEGYVRVYQSNYEDNPDNLKPNEARDLADNLKELADEVEDD